MSKIFEVGSIFIHFLFLISTGSHDKGKPTDFSFLKKTIFSEKKLLSEKSYYFFVFISNLLVNKYLEELVSLVSNRRNWTIGW